MITSQLRRARSHASNTATTLRHRSQGFTLIELLVAISVMALMSLMAWRGLDGMLRTQNTLQNHADEISHLQAGLAQWKTDLDQLAELSGTPSWDWDGQVLRLTRNSANALSLNTTTSVQVVAWTWRYDRRIDGGFWMRWQSGPIQQLSDWENT
jgi:general secretion pathway protein J